MGKEKQPKKKELDTLTTQITELTNSLKRVQADFENYKKRVEREQTEQKERSKIAIIKEIIPSIDHLELALAHANAEDEFCKGVQMIYNQMQEGLKNQGVKKTGNVDEMFNPKLHEAIESKTSEKPKNTIIEVKQQGYVLGDNVLRTSKVIVSNKEE